MEIVVNLLHGLQKSLLRITAIKPWRKLFHNKV